MKRFVESNHVNEIRLEDAAAIAGLERTYFSRLFRNVVGMRFSDWLSWYRLCRAVELMKTQDLQIAQIAHRVGFHDVRTFERAALKHTGSSPRVLRRRCTPLRVL